MKIYQLLKSGTLGCLSFFISLFLFLFFFAGGKEKQSKAEVARCFFHYLSVIQFKDSKIQYKMLLQ